jgi:multiple sugar transport system permease protein
MTASTDAATAIDQGAPPAAPPSSGVRRWRHTAVPYMFLLPGLVLFVALILYPVGRAFQMSLFDWSVVPGAESPFVGLGNYSRAFGDPVFWTATANTFIYMAVTVPAQMALGMLLALLLNAKIRGRVAFRTLYYLPVVTSWVVVSLVFSYLFNPDAGAINYLLVDVLGVADDNIVWLGNRWTALAAITILGIWKGMGWSMLVFLAALQGVPKDLMEAADIDGASRSRRFFSVTLPLLRPVVMFVTIMLVIGGFNVFISVFIMTGGGPAQQTEVLLTYMYNQAFGFLEFGYAAAIAYLVTLLILGVSVVQHKLFRGGEVT